MNAPTFYGLHSYAKPRTPKTQGPQAIPPHERLYRCECCNDTGIAQGWKLNKWAFPTSTPLNHNSTPIFCGQFPTCGDITLQVFAEAGDKKETQSRTETLNLFRSPGGEGTRIGTMIGQSRLQALSTNQSEYIHNKVLEYRQQLSVGAGKAWVDDVKDVCRAAMTTEHKADDGIARLCVAVELPPEPLMEPYAPPTVALAPDPKDFDTVLPPANPPTQDSKLPLTLDETKGTTSVQTGGTAHAANEHPDQPDQLPAAPGSQALPW